MAVSVADEGRGIPAASLPQLFRKFSRMAQSEEQGGDTGLGLAVCKGIVEAHGGRIWAESDGAGPRRLLHLHPAGGGRRRRAPRRPGARPIAARSPRRREQTEPNERVRVLAVDDDPYDLRYIREHPDRGGL